MCPAFVSHCGSRSVVKMRCISTGLPCRTTLQRTIRVDVIVHRGLVVLRRLKVDLRRRKWVVPTEVDPQPARGKSGVTVRTPHMYCSSSTLCAVEQHTTGSVAAARPEDFVGVQLRVADGVGALHQDAPGGDRLALLQHRAVGRVVGPLPQLALQGSAEAPCQVRVCGRAL
jgi:hypothetical protein